MSVANPTRLPLPRLAGHWIESVRTSRPPVAYARPTRLQLAAWVVITAAALGLALFEYDSYELGMYHDDAHYVILARSLLESDRYGLIYPPGEPAAPTFPFGFPLLLAPFLWLRPGHYDGLKFISLGATLVNIGILFWGWPWFSRTTSRWWGLAVGACYGLNPLVVSHARLVMSEAVFLTGCLAALLLAEWVAEGRGGWRALAALAGLLAALPNIRTVGLVFVAVIGAYLVLRLGRRSLKPLVAVALIGFLLNALVLLVTPVSVQDVFGVTWRYIREFQAFVDGSGRLPGYQARPYIAHIFVRASQHFMRDIRTAVWPLGGGQRESEFFESAGLSFAKDWVGLTVGLLVALGAGRGFWRDRSSLFWSAALGYYGVVGFWNWVGGRMLYPIVPQMYLGLFLGVEVIARAAGRPAALNRLGWLWKSLPGLAAAAALLLAVYKSVRLESSQAHLGSLSARTHWLAANAEAGAVIMSEAPPVDFLYSHHPMAPFPPAELAGSPEAVDAYLRAHDVGYVLLASHIGWQESFEPVYSDVTHAVGAALSELQSSGRVALVHELPALGLQVFRVVP